MVDSRVNGRGRSASSKKRERRRRAQERLKTSSAPAAPLAQLHAKNEGTRVVGDARFQQVTDFSQWCPPTRESESTPHWNRVQEEAWQERRRLMTYYPDALLADSSTLYTLEDEIPDLCAPGELPLTSTSCLLAIGEISDLSNPEDIAGHPVLAIAAGQLGDGLRLVSLSKQQWAWTEQHEVSLVLNGPGSLFDKLLPESRDTIACLKFALDNERPYPIRWLVVQKASCTTIYEPELHAAVDDGTDTSTPSLFLTSLATIQRRQTGGASQCNFSIKSISGEIPQLAIIDESGSWSLWDLYVPEGGNWLARSLKPVLRVQGTLHLGAIPRGIDVKRGGITRTHRLLMLSATIYKNGSRSQPRSQNGSGASDEKAGDNDTLTPFLLISDGASLYQHNLQTHTPVAMIQNVIRPGSRILDIAQSDLDTSEAFILTEKDLLWISAKINPKSGISVDVLKTCPHYQEDATNGPLRLEVSPAAATNGSKGCYVCVRSSQDTQVTIFSLVHTDGKGPQHQRELIELQAPFDFIGMTMLPAGRVDQEGDKSELAVKLDKAKARFFQFLVLSHDLEVGSALCVWSEDPKLQVPPPSIRVTADEEAFKNVRAEYLSEFGCGPDPGSAYKERDPGPRFLDKMNIPFTFTQGGQWHGLGKEEDDLDLEGDVKMEDDETLGKLTSVFDMPRGGITEESTVTMVEAIADQIKHEDIDRSPLFRSETGQGRGFASQSQSMSQMTISPSFPIRSRNEFSQDPFSSQIQSSQLFIASSQPSASQIQSPQLFVTQNTFIPASSQSQSQLFVTQNTAFPASSQMLPSPSPRRSRARPQSRLDEDPDGDEMINLLRKYTIDIDPDTETNSTTLFGPFDWKLDLDDVIDDVDWKANEETLDDSYDRWARRRRKLEAKRQRARARGRGITEPPTDHTTGGETDYSGGGGYVSSSMPAVVQDTVTGDEMLPPPVVSTKPTATTTAKFMSSTQTQPTGPAGLFSNTQPVISSSSRAANMFMSSQVDTTGIPPSSQMAPIFSSQVGSSLVVSSQVLGGKFGARKKKKKTDANSKTRTRTGFR